MTWKIYQDRLKNVEMTSRNASERQALIEGIDMQSHIAQCYHEIDQDIRNGSHEFYNLPGGRGSGKSSFCALEIVFGIMADKTEKSNALIVRKWAVTLRSSVFAQIQWAIDELGVSDRWKSSVVPMAFTFETGQRIQFTGLDDPNKLKSLKPTHGYFKYLWLEEFSEINGANELRNLQQSVLRGGNKFTVFRSFNPPINKNNWANVYIAIPDDRSLTRLTDYTMIPVEWLGESFIEEAERLREINSRAYEHEYLGLAVGSGGDVFPNIETREITDEEMNMFEYTFCGLDFGFASDPFCFVRLAYDRRHDTVYFLNEIYKKHCSNREIAQMIESNGWSKTKRQDDYSSYSIMLGGDIPNETNQVITCDCAEPKSIADLRSFGLKTRACHKEPGCVEYRVRWLQQRKLVIDPKRTPECFREFTNYEYMTDKDGSFISALPDKDNHSIDATAYALDTLIYNRRYSA